MNVLDQSDRETVELVARWALSYREHMSNDNTKITALAAGKLAGYEEALAIKHRMSSKDVRRQLREAMGVRYAK